MTKSATVTLYGIKNCDTMKKARTWLDDHGIEYAFHDYKAAGIEEGVLTGWARRLGWEVLLNRSGMTYRKVPDKLKEALNEQKAIALMHEQPGMIKRPVLAARGELIVGFRPEVYVSFFG